MSKLHYYKGFTFEKPEGSNYWNIWKPGKIHPFGGKTEIDVFCDTCMGYGRTLKECKLYIDEKE